LSTGWRLALRAGAIAPVCAVFRKPPIEEALGSAPGIDLGIARVVRDGWSAWGLGPRPHTLAWLLLTGGDASFNKVVGLVCSEPEPRARVAVKLSRSPTSVSGLQQESRSNSSPPHDPICEVSRGGSFASHTLPASHSARLSSTGDP
jgi:hypothetical protein